MATVPKLVPCLVALRGEFNVLNPARDRRSDGWISDRAHRDRMSDHNPDESGETPYADPDNVDEVHALDVDATGPWPAPFNVIVNEVVRRHRLGLDDRLQNVIYNGQIASRSWGWTWREYTGSNAHREHAHFSARYTAAHEASTRPWGLTARFASGKDFDHMDSEDRKALAKDIAEAIMASPVKVGDETWRYDTAVGYQTRKLYEIDKTADTAAAAAKPATPAPAKSTTTPKPAAPAGSAKSTAGR